MSKTKAPVKSGEKKRRTRSQETWHQFRKNKGAMVGLVVFCMILVAAIIAQFAYDYTTDITKMNVSQMLLPPPGSTHLVRITWAATSWPACCMARAIR